MAVLCFIDDIDEDDIKYIQPMLDATDETGQGGWTRLLTYLSSNRFREDLGVFDHLIIQVDTDVATLAGFDVVVMDENYKLLPIETIIDRVIERLILAIDLNDKIYHKHESKIIFSISVASLECWLHNFYVKDHKKINTTHNCFDKLLSELKKDKSKPTLSKKRDIYDTISTPLSKNKNIKELCKKILVFLFLLID